MLEGFVHVFALFFDGFACRFFSNAAKQQWIPKTSCVIYILLAVYCFFFFKLRAISLWAHERKKKPSMFYLSAHKFIIIEVCEYYSNDRNRSDKSAALHFEFICAATFKIYLFVCLCEKTHWRTNERNFKVAACFAHNSPLAWNGPHSIDLVDYIFHTVLAFVHEI